MKIFLLLLIFICCLIIGFLIKNYFIKRKEFYENLNIFCKNLSVNISFNNEKLKTIINNDINNYSKDFNEFLFVFDKYIKNNKSKIELKKDFENKLNFLSYDEKGILISFLFLLGTQTTEEEIVKINNFNEIINKSKEETIIKNKKYSSLYFKLFLFLGMLIFIIFI